MNNASKLSEDQANELIKLRVEGLSYVELANKFNIGKTTVGHIVKGTT